MCNPRFLEGSTGVVNLPDDDPVLAGCMVAYLYSGNFKIGLQPVERSEPEVEEAADPNVAWDSADSESIDKNDQEEEDQEIHQEQTHSDPETLKILGGVYVLAEKYQLNDLKDLCVEKMKTVVDLSVDAKSFLQTVACIYHGTPESDLFFRPYLRTRCPEMLMELDKDKTSVHIIEQYWLSCSGSLPWLSRASHDSRLSKARG